MHPFDLSTLSQCTICKITFNNTREYKDFNSNSKCEISKETKTEKVLHMISHFDQDILKSIKKNKDGTSYQCLLVREY